MGINNNTNDAEAARIWYQAFMSIAIVGGIFSLVVLALLVTNYIQLKSDPLNSLELADLKATLGRQPENEHIKDQIRALDLQLRKEYFQHRYLSRVGGYLLIGGMVVFLTGIKFITSRKKLKAVFYEQVEQIRVTSRWSVAILGLIAGGSALVLMLSAERGLTSKFLENAYLIVETASPTASETEQQSPSQAEAAQQTDVSEGSPFAAQTLQPSASYPSLEEIKKNWSRFRGAEGLGISIYSNVPSSWNGKTGSGILWKTAISLPGENSPVVWGDRVFLTGADEKKREVYCFDANTGKLLWQKPVENVPGSSPTPPEVSEDTGFAAPTATTDGQRVYAIFANSDLVCFDFNGNQIWVKNLGSPRNIYGHASSLSMYHNLLIIQFDQGAADDNLSRLIAINGDTGEITWQTQRPVPNSWTTPIVVNTGKRKELITCANPYVISYDPATGNEFWRAECLSGDVAPSPVYMNGVVYAVNAYAKLAAIRTDGAGNVTKTNIAWTADEGLPDICSPLTNGDLIFLLQTYGLLTCYDVKDGKKIWEHDLAETFLASPSLVGDNVYLLTENGLMIIIKADREYKEIGRCELGEKADTSPAFLDGRIYIRGKENLYCISNPKK